MRNECAAQDLSSNHLLSFMIPPKVLLWMSKKRAARNGQILVRICMGRQTNADTRQRGSVETLILCCYALAAEAYIDGMMHRKRPAIESLFQGLSAEGSRR